MNKLEIKIQFDDLATAKNTPILTVLNVWSEEDLDVVKAILAAIKNVKN